MGLDVVELVMAVEESFEIAIDDADAANMRTVGDLEALIASKLVSKASGGCLTSFVFYRLRSALGRRFGVERARVRPGASLADVVPRQHRRAAWATLADALGWRLPDLRRNRPLEGAMLFTGLGAIPAAVIMRSLGVLSGSAAWAIGLGALPGLWLAYKMTAPLAVHLPASCATVGLATEAALALNFGRIARERQAWSEKELWDVLSRTVVERLGVDPAAVTRDARFVEDLGAG